MPQTRTNAQRGLQVVRSVQGLAAALVGMKNVAHVEENLELSRIPCLLPQRALEILSACRR
jgi:aryl-alcohol dehydrogenase-like predicted oxidoreductase